MKWSRIQYIHSFIYILYVRTSSVVEKSRYIHTIFAMTVNNKQRANNQNNIDFRNHFNESLRKPRGKKNKLYQEPIRLSP